MKNKIDMKYIAKIKVNRNGAKLMLYLKFWFVLIPIEGYGRYLNKSIWFVIERDIVSWKKYYGDKLKKIFNFKIVNKKEYNYLVHFKDSNTGLYAIDQNPKNVNYKWIIDNNFRIK